MPAVAPYIPSKDSGVNSFAANFSTLITASPSTYGLSAGDATTIAGITATWTAAYALVTSPSTKTAATVSAKNAARVNLLATIRPYSQLIANNAAVSSSAKIALGLNARTSVPTPITPPVTTPILSITGGSVLQQILRYRDSASSPSVKSKPYGVIQVQLFGKTSTTPITDPTTLPLLLSQTKSPFAVTWAGGSSGEMAYYAARYVIRKGGISMWSPIVSAAIM